GYPGGREAKTFSSGCLLGFGDLVPHAPRPDRVRVGGGGFDDGARRLTGHDHAVSGVDERMAGPRCGGVAGEVAREAAAVGDAEHARREFADADVHRCLLVSRPMISSAMTTPICTWMMNRVSVTEAIASSRLASSPPSPQRPRRHAAERRWAVRSAA